MNTSRMFIGLVLGIVVMVALAAGVSTVVASSPGWSPMMPGAQLTDGLMVFDSDHELLIAYGGRDKYVNKSSEASDALFAYEESYVDAEWIDIGERASGIKPPEMHSSAGIYWPTLKNMTFFSGSGNHDDVWSLDLSKGLSGLRWQHPRVGGHADARSNHSAVYVPELDAMVVFGGNKKSTSVPRDAIDDAMALVRSGSGFMWRPVDATDGPGARYDHSAIYDPINHWMVVYGGTLTKFTAAYDDVWALDFSTPTAPKWLDLSASIQGDKPGARKGQTAVYDPKRQYMVVYGGSGSTAQQVWALDLSGGLNGLHWVVLDNGKQGSELPARSGHTAAWLPDDDCMVVYEGSAKFNELADTWMFHPADSTGHNYKPRPENSCDAAMPGSTCAAQLTVQVMVDYRCDGIYSAGNDQLVSGALVTVVSPAQKKTFTATTDSRGRAHFDGLDVPANMPLTVSVDTSQVLPGGAYAWCSYPNGSATFTAAMFRSGRTGSLIMGMSPNR